MTSRVKGRALGRKDSPTTEVQQAVDELQELMRQRPALSAHIKVLTEALPVLYRDSPTEAAPALSANDCATKFERGLPLLRGADVTIDVKRFRRRWKQVANAICRQREDVSESALRGAMDRGKLDAKQLLHELLDGATSSLRDGFAAAGLDAELACTVFRLALFPLMSMLNRELQPLRESLRWPQGYCPTCGCWPLLGEYRGLEQTRWLRCGLCASEWQFPRLKCFHCGTADHRQLGYLHVEGEGTKFRAATCDHCQYYIKMATTLTSLSPPQLLATDAATLHLDLAAVERGYSGFVTLKQIAGAEGVEH